MKTIHIVVVIFSLLLTLKPEAWCSNNTVTLKDPKISMNAVINALGQSTQKVVLDFTATLQAAIASPTWGAQTLELRHTQAKEILETCLQHLSINAEGKRALQTLPLSAVESRMEQLVKLEPPPSTSFPLVRRALMAGMFLQMERNLATNKSLTWQRSYQAIEPSWSRVLELLYKLHTRSSTARGLIEHIHVSKAAGSTVCQLAKKNGCTSKIMRPMGGLGNCLIVELDDMPRWISPQVHLRLGFPEHPIKRFVRHEEVRSPAYSCAQRAELMKSRKWNFYGNEYTALSERNASSQPQIISKRFKRQSSLVADQGKAIQVHNISGKIHLSPLNRRQHSLEQVAGSTSRRAQEDRMKRGTPLNHQGSSLYKLQGGTCKEFVTMLVFRHPFHRLKSHVNFIMDQYESLYGRSPLRRQEIRKKFQRLSSSDWKELAPPILDNYYIRTLLGEAAYNSPSGSLRDGDLSVALQVLASIDILLISGLHFVDHWNALYGLGWRYGLQDHFSNVAIPSRGSSSISDGQSTTSEMTRRMLLHRNDLFPDLHRSNTLDMRLYSSAQVISFLDALLFYHVGKMKERSFGTGESSLATCGLIGLD